MASDLASKAETIRGVVETGRQVIQTVQQWLSSDDDSTTLPEVRYELFVEGASSPWKVHQLRLREAASELYELTLDLAIEDLTADSDELLEKRCCLEITRGTLLERRYGEVRRVERLGLTNTRRLARITLVPALYRLSQAIDARIFQDLAAPEIVSTVLDGHRIYQSTLVLELDREYPAREYCVQYHETDLAFVMRLLEEEGIALYFRHDENSDGEQLVLTDHARGLPAVPTLDDAPAPMAGPESATLHVESVRYFDGAIETRTTGTTLRDFDWTRPALDLTQASPSDAGARAAYEYPAELTIGGYATPSYGQDDRVDQARVRQEARVATAKYSTARSNLIGVKPGAFLEITGHGDAGHDGKYLVLRAEHSGYVSEVVAGETQHNQGDRERYRNELTCIPFEVPFRPERRTPKPRVFGMQTATVVGPEGEEIYTDEHGRVKVQFHWDRAGVRDELSSCWIRVMQAWAGPGWGTIFLPRIGMEVVVNFLEGNPDRPLVIGCVYNGTNRPPYPLPDEKTKSTIKTRSSLESEGFNELRFEDLKDSEEVFLHAQKDLNEVVENDHTTTVHANQTIKVDKNQTVSVGGAQTISVGGAQSETVDKNVTVHIKGSQSVTIDGGEAADGVSGAKLNITGDQVVDASKTISLQAPDKITLTCGGSSITLEPGKITLVAGDGSEIVLDANALMKSSHGSKTLHGPDTHLFASSGADLMLTANASLQSKAGSQVLLDANAKAEASTGGKLELTANAAMEGKEASVTGQTKATVTGATEATLTATGTVKASPAGVDVSGAQVNVKADAMANISGGIVKIN